MNTPRNRQISSSQASEASEASSSRPRAEGRPGRTKSARELAAEVVARVLYDDAWATPVLNAVLSRHELSGRDRGLCTELSYGTLRYASALEQSLQAVSSHKTRKLDKRAGPHLLVAAYQLQHLSERIPARAAVNEAVKAIKRVRPQMAGFANAILRKLGPAPHSLLKPGAAVAEHARVHGIPILLQEAMTALLPQAELAQAFAAQNARPPVSVALLDSDAPQIDDAEFHPFVPKCLFLSGGGDVTALPGFAEGKIQIQDPGSQIVGHLCAVTSETRVLEMCAAPGSKSVALAKRGAKVRAVELSATRAQRIEENAERCQVDVEVRVQDARTLEASGSPQEQADVVLLDAPCSALGTLRRHPELRWRRTPEDVQKSAQLQRELLDAAASLVRDGGRLVYAVCSPQPLEGPEQISAFLQTHPDFQVAPAGEILSWLPADALNDDGTIGLWPHRHQSDAFYIAAMSKDATENA